MPSPAEKLHALADESERGYEEAEWAVAAAIYRTGALIIEALTDTPARGADEELRPKERADGR